jgi:AAA-like domain/TIR domain
MQGERNMKVFISYKRNVDPDQRVAALVCNALQRAGHQVFIDQTLTIGQEWAREIERKVRESDFVIVFLSLASSHSEMVKGEIEIARDQSTNAKTSPQILPIRLGYTGALPYPLGAWLDPIQYSLWRGEADTETIVSELLVAVDGAPLPLQTKRHTGANNLESLPFYSAPLPSPGGSLDVGDPRYIRRETDETAVRSISQLGVTLTIKGSRQMGKSSLLIRTLARAMDCGKRCSLLDFQLLGKHTLQDGHTFFRRFVQSIADQLDLPNETAQYWDPNLSDSQNCTRYIERCILQPIASPVVIAIDEADHLFDFDCRNDFFGMLRAWHNGRANPLKKIWKNLDLVLA